MRGKMKRYFMMVIPTIVVFMGFMICSKGVLAVGTYGANTESDAYMSSINPFYRSLDEYGNRYLIGQCTWYCWGRAYEKGTELFWNGGRFEHAKEWYKYAAAEGYKCDTTPTANSIMVSSKGGYTGHVMFVEKVEGDYACISEFNFAGSGYHEDKIDLSTGKRASCNYSENIVGYIHLDGGSSNVRVDKGQGGIYCTDEMVSISVDDTGYSGLNLCIYRTPLDGVAGKDTYEYWEGDVYSNPYKVSFSQTGSYSCFFRITKGGHTYESGWVGWRVIERPVVSLDKGQNTAYDLGETVSIGVNVAGYSSLNLCIYRTPLDGVAGKDTYEYWEGDVYSNPYKVSFSQSGYYSCCFRIREGEKEYESGWIGWTVKTSQGSEPQPSKNNIANAKVSGVFDETYSGKAITQNPVVVVDSVTLKEGTDYSLSYSNNVNIGTAMMTITGMGDYIGTMTLTFKIVDVVNPPTIKTIVYAAVTGVENKAYTGNAITQTPIVKVDGVTLIEGTNYVLSYKNNINVGTATMTVTGKGNYTGKKDVLFEILPEDTPQSIPLLKSIVSATVTGVVDKTYTGKAITQNPTVKVDGITLKNGTDYTLSYRNNVYAGTATMIITGKDNYTGTKSVNFNISLTAEQAKKMENATVIGLTDKAYTGKAIKPFITVKMGNKTLKSKKDFTVSYKNNKKVGTATITLKGKGKIKGTKKVTFKITKAANPLKVTGKTAKVKNVNKNKQTLAVSKVIKITKKGQGKVTYKKVDGDTRITMNSKGKVTVAKGTPAKEYKIKANVKASGNGNYKSTIRTVTFKLKVS